MKIIQFVWFDNNDNNNNNEIYLKHGPQSSNVVELGVMYMYHS